MYKNKKPPLQTLRTAEVLCSTHRPTFSVAPQRCTYPQAIQKYFTLFIYAIVIS